MIDNCPYIELSQITTTINGLWTGKKPPFQTVAVIRNTNFSKDCKLKMDDVAMIEVETKQFATRKLQFGDIIIEKSGGSDKQPVGRPILFNLQEGDYSFSNFTATLRVNNKNEVLPEYLHKFLYGFYLTGKTASMQSKTTGLHNLDFKAYKSILVPVPTLERQRQIVEELNLLEGIIEKKNEQIKYLDQLADSIFYEMFGDPILNEKKWDVQFLEEFVTTDCPISYGIVQPGDGETDGVPVVRPLDMIGIFTHNKGLKKTTKEISDSYKRTILKGNELLLCVRGTTGIVSLAAQDLKDCNVSRGITPLEFNDDVSRWFMLFQFKTAGVQNIIADLTHGIALKGINMADVRKLKMIKPSFDLQKKFENKVTLLYKQQEHISASLKITENLLASRMDKYFSE